MTRALDLPLPVDGKPHAVSMGTRPMAAHEWLLVDRGRGDELRLKAELLSDRHREVFAALPVSTAPSEEVLGLVLADLEQRQPPLVQVEGDLIRERTTGATWDRRARHPLDLAARLVQEDLCVMQKGPAEGEWILTAASVCFPSRWLLAEKVGRTLAQIHEPVPGYGRIERATDLAFDRLTADRPLKRTNWTLIDDPTLFQPRPEARTKAGRGVGDRVLDQVFLRVERQTIRLLPSTGAALFTIRTSVDALAALSPAEREALRATLATVDADTVVYKGWQALLPAVMEALAPV